jgi:pimeloyl-ACP methyl ester carboxylesterase
MIISALPLSQQGLQTKAQPGFSGDRMDAIEHIVRHPRERKFATPLFLQHGAWHGAWCWENWLAYFAERGYETHAISLPGHGQSPLGKRSLNLYTLGDYTDVLAAEIDKLRAPPVVIGHSLGGAILQKYLQHHSLPGAVLLATLPPRGISGMILRKLRQHPLPTLKGLLTLNLYHCVGTPALARSWFLSEDAPVDIGAYQKKLCGESYAIAMQTLLPFLRVKTTKVPMLVVAAGNDNVFTVAEEKATAQKFKADFMLIENQAHNLMIDSDWQAVAERIDRWMRDSGIP